MATKGSSREAFLTGIWLISHRYALLSIAVHGEVKCAIGEDAWTSFWQSRGLDAAEVDRMANCHAQTVVEYFRQHPPDSAE
jgi:hypothetical protein